MCNCVSGYGGVNCQTGIVNLGTGDRVMYIGQDIKILHLSTKKDNE